MLTRNQTEDMAKDVQEIAQTMRRQLREQFQGAGPGVSKLNDREFMGWIVTNVQFHGVLPFFSALQKVAPRDLDRFERITRTGRYGDGAAV